MTGFADPTAAEAMLKRAEALTQRPVRAFLTSAALESPNPDQALVQLERWLGAVSEPGLMADHLLATDPLSRQLLVLFGASEQMADVLVQNPELANLVLDPSQLAKRPTPEFVRELADRLTAASVSYSHTLDRLRFLKQKWMVVVAMNDLSRSWPEEDVWHALSVVAASLLAILREHVWAHYAGERGLEGPCPVTIVAMGKLGGYELNYSSDVDLVYVLRDDAHEAEERHAQRFCEAYGRALADRMGRGALYRVDLRLRPFGSSGPIVSRFRAVEAYYERYAEPWEHLALIRSAPLGADAEFQARWAAMREATVFRGPRSEIVVDELLAMRERLEGLREVDDLKRGPGGIRDVEFLTQITQMLAGQGHPELQVAGTLPALRALRAAGRLTEDAAEELAAAYTFLRQVEHRCQICGDLQTHELPRTESGLYFLARRMGYADTATFLADLARFRTRVRARYRELLHREDRGDPRERLRVDDPALVTWLDAMPDPASYYAAVSTNEGSLARLRTVAQGAPAYEGLLRESPVVTEAIVSGEVEEAGPPLRPPTAGPAMARWLRDGRLSTLVREVLRPDHEPAPELSALYDTALEALRSRVGGEFDVFALGSAATRDLGPDSDVDLLLLAPDDAPPGAAERAAQELLNQVQGLRTAGSPLAIDLRLRPEGRKGLLVVTDAGLRAYAARDQEPWERFALGRARLIAGRPEARTIVFDIAYGAGWSPDAIAGLLPMKRRIENERVSPAERRRHVKLGTGGLDDIEWLVQLALFAHPALALPGADVRTVDRITTIGQAGVLNAVQCDELREAHAFLLRLRWRIARLGFAPDVLPENPDKLSKLAASFDWVGANALLARYEELTHGVRAIYEDTVRRLTA